MERFLMLSFLLIAVAATSDVEVYWKKTFPNTPMPRAIQDLVHPEVYNDEKGTAVNVGKGGVNVNTGKGTNVNVGHGTVGVHTGKGTNVNVGHGSIGVHTPNGKPGGGTNVNVGRGGVGVHTGRGTNVHVGKGGVNVNVPPKKKPVIVNMGGFVYRYAATETQLHDDRSVALFFLKKSLRAGTHMKLHFTRTVPRVQLLSRSVADSIPFSSSKLPEILHSFGIKPDTTEAASMKNTLLECEEPPLSGEIKHCATSLPSMVEFATSALGTDYIEPYPSPPSYGDHPKQTYTINDLKKLPGTNFVACHAQTYAYAVFYCHKTAETEVYKVRMEGKDGTMVEAVAVCHDDTEKWNPKHIAFQLLNVKPGTVPVCHFLPQDHIVWGVKK